MTQSVKPRSWTLYLPFCSVSCILNIESETQKCDTYTDMIFCFQACVMYVKIMSFIYLIYLCLVLLPGFSVSK